MEWTAAIARAVINPRHGVHEAQDGHFMEITHLPLKLHLPASVTIGGCMSTATVYRMINTLEEIGAIDRKNMYRVQVS